MSFCWAVALHLQIWSCTACRYDVIWIQWALLYLTDGKRLPKRNIVYMFLTLALFLLVYICCWHHQFCFYIQPQYTTAPSMVKGPLSNSTSFKIDVCVDDAVSFFDRCKTGLKPGGVVVVKENICKHTEFVVDKEDSSLTRSNKYMLQLFAKSNMTVLYNVLQRKFPKELFPVRIYAIKPRTS